jgi:hypothetical protein
MPWREGEMAKSAKKTGEGVSEAADEVSCVAASPLKYNGTRYPEGETLTLPRELYDELRASGVVTPPEPQKAETEKPAT